jgi:hypothetical protein
VAREKKLPGRRTQAYRRLVVEAENHILEMCSKYGSIPQAALIADGKEQLDRAYIYDVALINLQGRGLVRFESSPVGGHWLLTTLLERVAKAAK